METLLTSRLLASADLAPLCAARIGWDEAQQDWAAPYIVLTLVTAPMDYHLKGESGLQRAVVQADCYARTRAEALALSEALTLFTRTAAWDGQISVKVQDRRALRPEPGPVTLFSRSTDLRVTYKGG